MRLLRCRRGSVIMVELAVFGLGLILLGLLGGLQWSINNSTVGALEQAAREGGRYYAITGDDPGARDEIRQILTGTGLAIKPGKFDQAGDVTISETDGYVTVTVRYHQGQFVPGISKSAGGRGGSPVRTFTASATYRKETP